MRPIALLVPVAALLCSQTARAQSVPAQPAEPATAAAPQSAPATTVPAPSGDAKTSSDPTFVVAKWKTKIYGFIESDNMYDSTQSFNEIQGGSIIAPVAAVGGVNSRLVFSARNSRLGFSLESPDYDGIKATSLIEFDLFGFDPAPFPSAAVPNATNSEASFFSSPTVRIRHAWLKIATPFLDITAGQSWSLFGLQPIFQPATAELQGLPGELFQRTPQIRVSKTLGLGDSKLDLQVAAQRPQQRDSSLPELVGAVRFELGGYQGYKSTGGTGGGLTGITVGVSGTYRNYRLVTANNGTPTSYTTASSSAIALDAIIPILPATKASRAGALTLLGEATKGSGYADAFTGTNFGAQIGLPPGLAAGAVYPVPNVDPGLVGWQPGTTTPALETVDIQSLNVGAQFYLPVCNGCVFLTGMFGVVQSPNVRDFSVKPGSVFVDEKLTVGGLFWDVTPSVRVAVEEGFTRMTMGDGQIRNNSRSQLSFWFIF